jgi:cytochrome c
MRRAIVTILVTLASAALAGCGSAGGEPYRSVAGGDASRGPAKLLHYGCGSCHVIPGVDGASGIVGPPLLWFGRRTVIAGEVQNTADELVAWIRNPQSIEPNTIMPNLGVTEPDARDMAAYLYTLR